MPLVTIAIPTYNRRDQLSRALDSALAQTHANVEVVISDNASGDDTEAFCRTRAAADDRVRYQRMSRNEGPIANFNAVLGMGHGDYVMPLADDDWLEPDYVERCLAQALAEPGVALVAGRALYWRDDELVREGTPHHHHQASASARLLDFWRTVDDAACFYGLSPRSLMAQSLPLKAEIAFDWMHLARLSFAGRVRTLPETAINRSLGGTSVDRESLIDQVGIPRAQVQLSPLFIAGIAWADVVWRSPMYGTLGRPRRIVLGARVAAIVLRRFLTVSAVRERLRG